MEIRVGSYASGAPRLEVQHWQNLKPAVLKEGQEPATRVSRGRKPATATSPTLLTSPEKTDSDDSPQLSPWAPEFVPESPAVPETTKEVPEYSTRIVTNTTVNPLNMRPQRVKKKPDRYA